MPAVVRFMLISFATGVALGWVLAGVLFWCDALGLASLILRSDHGWLVTAMLLLSVGGTFGVCFTATALEFLASGGEGPALAPRPLRRAVAVRARSRTAPRPGTHTKN